MASNCHSLIWNLIENIHHISSYSIGMSKNTLVIIYETVNYKKQIENDFNIPVIMDFQYRIFPIKNPGILFEF